jgi:tetratricopeptide (TPR) repeat protein
MSGGFFARNGYRWSARLSGFFWHLWMVAIVLTLAVIALPKPLVDAAACRISAAYCARAVPQLAGPVATGMESRPVGPQAEPGRTSHDSSSERFESIKAEQDRLFSLIVALAALLTFLGFKGVQSLLDAQRSAREAMENARQYEERWQLQYPRDNRAEMAVAMAAALRDITDMQLHILRQMGSANPDRSGLYSDYLHTARRHLETVEDTDCSTPIKLQVLGILGNVYYRLESYDSAFRSARKAIEIDAGDTDAYFNATCYLCKMAEIAESQKKPHEANRLLRQAISYAKQYVAREENKGVAGKTLDEEIDLKILRERMQSEYDLLTA